MLHLRSACRSFAVTLFTCARPSIGMTMTQDIRERSKFTGGGLAQLGGGAKILVNGNGGGKILVHSFRGGKISVQVILPCEGGQNSGACGFRK